MSLLGQIRGFGGFLMAGFQNRCKSIAKTAFIALSLAVAFALPAHAAYLDSFEQGGTFFDDGVGVVHIRPSKSKTETDYAPGIPASQGNNYARLLVQAWLQNGCFTDTSGNSFCGINGSQAPNACRPGGLESDNSVNCDGPLTEWGLPYGHFDKGVAITGNGATTSLDIYLDTNFAMNSTAAWKDYRFDWDSDLLDNQGKFLQDYVFNVAVGDGHDSCAPSTGGYFVIEASTNSQRSGANAHNTANTQSCITQSGWYTFTHTFTKDHDGNLEVDMTVAPAQTNHAVGTWTIHPSCLAAQIADGACPTDATATTPLPFSAVGANFLGWFPDQEINNLAIDNAQRSDLH
jgi:hypothetical protein